MYSVSIGADTVQSVSDGFDALFAYVAPLWHRFAGLFGPVLPRYGGEERGQIGHGVTRSEGVPE